MNPFPRIQQDAADAVLAHASFASVPIVVDDGAWRGPVESALADGGACVLVGLPVEWDATDQAHKMATGEVSFTVELFWNANRRAELGSTVKPLDLLGDLIVALLAAPLLPARNHMTVAGFDVIPMEVGLFAFAVSVRRSATVS